MSFSKYMSASINRVNGKHAQKESFLLTVHRKKQKTMKDEDLKKRKEETRKTNRGAYLGCLLLIMANERYGSVKHFLHKEFLAENQQCPRDM